MDSDNKKDRNNRDRNPFDIFRNENEFNRIFNAIERMMKKSFKDIPTSIKPGSSFIRGFNVHIGPDGEPIIEEFGNFPKKISDGKTVLSEEREPLIDIIENHNNVAITIEVPGVKKENINLDLIDERLEIKVDQPERKYYKVINLPCNVKPRTIKTTYNNGVLDIEIEKKKKSKNNNGYKVDID